MKRTFTYLVFSMLVFAACHMQAQTDSVKWPLSANQTFTAYGNMSALNQTLSNLVVSAYSGYETSQKTSNPTSQTLPTGFDSTTYHQYVVTPVAGKTLNIDSIHMKLGSATGNLRVVVAYSLDSTFATKTMLADGTSPLIPPKAVLTMFSFGVNKLVLNNQSFYLRIYPYLTATSTTKPLNCKDVVIQATSMTPGALATVSTAPPYNITVNSALSGGTIPHVGNSNVSARGVCWSTNPLPTITDQHTTDGAGSGTFLSTISGLQSGTLYHIRAYATNDLGTSYGADTTFTTLTQFTVPGVTTLSISNLYTVSASGGGNVTFDGGQTVTARGVCWSLLPNPTVTDQHTMDSAGLGNFSSSITGLSPATLYHVRAYAVNVTGIGYGGDSTFTTLPLSVPAVITANGSFIMLNSASCGGSVTFDGGLKVTARGICYNTTGLPTLSDNKTSDSSGLGIFGSMMTKLSPGTMYYVRAYATNSLGTSYGSQVTVTTLLQGQTIIVAKDGSGNYTTVAEAFKAIPKSSSTVTTVYIKKGLYFEKDTLAGPIANVIICGEDRDSTIIQFDDYSGRVVGNTTLGTSTSQTVWVTSTVTDVVFENLTIQNTSTVAQAVALNIQGDRIFLKNCKLLGYQDTYYTWGVGRLYHKNCYIAGSVDFIFGSSIAVFDSCEIHVRRNNSTLTAASTPVGFKFGYVFRNSQISADTIGFDSNPVNLIYFGRPWQNLPRTVFMHCYEPANIAPAGWMTWNVTPGLYAEFACFGPGSLNQSQRIISRQLDTVEAGNYTTANIFARGAGTSYTSDWFPTDVGIVSLTPTRIANSTPERITGYSLRTYPNPFNPSATLEYQVSENGLVSIKLYDVLGNEIKTVLNEMKTAGKYKLNISGNGLSSGVYFARMQAGKMVITNKIVLLK
jgi:pectinesterase